MAYIEMKHSYKRYPSGETDIIANKDVTFEIEKGELVIIWGHQAQENQRFSIFWEVWIPMMKGRF